MVTKQKRFLGVILAAFVTFALVFALIPAHKVAADDYPLPCKAGDSQVDVNGTPMCRTANTTTPQQGQADPSNGQTTDQTTCAIEKLGWILCPVVETSGKIADSAFQQLSKHFLETEPELVSSFNGSGNKPGTYIAWELARNIANIMFIIAFLIIIFSQVTGRGLDNYGIKKLLPKLIIAAIAVNISYYICQAMVDLTNIMGYEIQNFLVETSRQVSDRAAMPVAAGNGSITQTSDVIGHGTLATIAIGALGLTIALILMPLLGTGITAILIVCVVIIIILLMRKAFIVLLVVASPVAFVFYLLPNTEKLFQKWLKMFWQLLMVFPVIGILFGGGQLASAIILVAGTQLGTGTDTQNQQTNASSAGGHNFYSDGSNRCIQLPSSDPKAQGDLAQAKVGTCGARSTPLMLGLTAAAIAVAPLFAVWSVLKGALSAAGAIGGKIQGAVVGAGSKMREPANKWEKGMRDNAAVMAYNNGVTRPFAGKVRQFRRRGDVREAKLKAAQAISDSTIGKGSSLEIMKQQAVQNLGKTKEAEEFAERFAEDPNFVGKALGAAKGNTALQSALEIQQTKAKAEAQKDIEARLDPADLQGLEDGLKRAILAGNTLEARAYQSALLRSGSPGQERFHNAVGGAVAAGGENGEMAKELQRNMLSNFGGYKDSDWASGKWSETSGASLGDLSKIRNDASKFESMTAAKFASQTGQGQAHAANILGAAKASELQAALRGSPELLGKIDPSVRKKWGI